mgnify:CR=1 FL=1
MRLGAYLTGPFGQSQNLYQARNEAKRKRGSQEKVIEQIEKDTKKVIALQHKHGLDFIIDPMFSLFYLFQPFAEKVRGIKEGPQENWFNNNVFYWRPQIEGPLHLQTGFIEQFIHLQNLPKNGTTMVILPSPYTLLMLSDIRGYSDRRQAVVNLGEIIKAEAEHLVSKGVERIQYDEPVIVVRQSLGSLIEEDLLLLKKGIEVCGHIDGATTSLHTYFGDAGPIIPQLIRLPVDCIGIDGTETSLPDILRYDYSGKEVALGLIDARNTSLENPEDIVKQLKTIAEKSHPTRLWLTPNTGTEYKGYTHGIKKLEVLAKVRQMLYE